VPPVAMHVRHHNRADHPIPARRATRTSRALRARADLIAFSNSDPPDDNSTANAYPALLGTHPTAAVAHSKSSTTSVHFTVVTYGTVSTVIVLAAILVVIYILRARKRARMIQSSTNALKTGVSSPKG
jgi:hypothetical protein